MEEAGKPNLFSLHPKSLVDFSVNFNSFLEEFYNKEFESVKKELTLILLAFLSLENLFLKYLPHIFLLFLEAILVALILCV